MNVLKKLRKQYHYSNIRFKMMMPSIWLFFFVLPFVIVAVVTVTCRYAFMIEFNARKPLQMLQTFKYRLLFTKEQWEDFQNDGRDDLWWEFGLWFMFDLILFGVLIMIADLVTAIPLIIALSFMVIRSLIIGVRKL
ncbi:hypothetical protein VPHK567_0267 [Vibrio phage K567]